MRAVLSLVAMALGCSACASRQAPRPANAQVTTEAAPAWLQAARIDTVRDVMSLPHRFASARAGLPRRIAARAASEGALLDPTAAESAPDLPPGPYYCRMMRLGGRIGLRAYTPDLCHVIASGDGIAFAKADGENIIDGWLYPDTDRRRILLGALRRGGTPGKGRYGDNPAQDVAGIVERVSAFRWRLLLTRAGDGGTGGGMGGGTIDLYELVPVTPLVPGAKPAVPSD